MSTSTFFSFSRLPFELRSQIWEMSIPTSTTINIHEGADLEVTSISSPPGQAMANKESRETYLAKGFKTFGVLTTEDWEDTHINEETTLELVIEPSKNPKANLNITWTELEVLLYEVIPLVKKLHIAWSMPDRLVRLWIAPEAGLVRVGQTHFDENIFPFETLVSDRKYRESLRDGLRVTTSAATLEEMVLGSGKEVKTWELVGEKVLAGFGPEAVISTTKAFKLVGEEEDIGVEQWEEMGAVDAEEVRGGCVALTEEAIAKFLQETGWEPKSSTPSSIYSREMFYDGELWLTVA